MKFSYPLIKKMVPALPGAKDFADKFNAYGFEVESAEGDTIDIKLPANRYADASSHWGIAKEAAAIWDTKLKSPLKTIVNPPSRSALSAKIEDVKFCGRYGARLFEIGKHSATPKWMQEVLRACGLRPISAIVDVMNYVMLEVGQPLHAFDADKLYGEKEKKIFVRKAKRDEVIVALDDHRYSLDRDVFVIADKERPLAIAGIKGGKYAEVSRDTKRIMVEAAYFDPVATFKASRKLKLATDASARFAHGLHPELVGVALDRATVLLHEFFGARLIDSVDTYPRKANEEVIGLRISRLNSMLGTVLAASNAASYLRRVGFKVSPKSKDVLLVHAPSLRADIAAEEDVIEEIARLHGLSAIAPQAPVSMLKSTEYQDEVRLKDVVRNVLAGLGLNEVYNGTFVAHGSEEAILAPLPAGARFALVELENPIAEDKKYLRPTLLSGILKNIEDNFRFFEEVRIFEVGKVFFELHGKMQERWQLALALAPKKGISFLELKGVVSELLERVGLMEYRFKSTGECVVIESNHHILGYMKPVSVGRKYTASLAEIYVEKLLDVVAGEKEYLPLPKYPSIARDVSLLVDRSVRVGELLEVINNAPARYVEDVDMIDFYEDPKLSEEKKSVTFRFVFQAEDRTLTDAEAGDELEKILAALREKFDAEIR